MKKVVQRIAILLIAWTLSFCCMMGMFTKYDFGIKNYIGSAVDNALDCLAYAVNNIQHNGCDGWAKAWDISGYVLIGVLALVFSCAVLGAYIDEEKIEKESRKE